MAHLFGSGFVLSRQELMTDPADWLLVAVLLLVMIGLTGCADLRRLTMDREQLRFFESIEISPCLDPSVVCIHE